MHLNLSDEQLYVCITMYSVGSIVNNCVVS